jgi:hypothetical protein
VIEFDFKNNGLGRCYLDKGWPHLVATTMVVFVAFLPFFAFRETGRAIGERRLYDLFFRKVEEK